VTWIVPEYQKIFKDFDLPLPHSTQLLVGLSQFSVSYWYLFYPLFVLGMALLFLPAACYFGWDLPGMNWFTRRLDAADLLDGLALTARQQKQMLDGLDALAQSHPRTNIRLRLLQAVKDVQAGRDWAESLSSRGLLRRPDLAILQAAGRVGNLPWALREMAESNRRRFAYRLQAIVQAVFPPVVILLGVIVGFIAVALFLPLVLLIQALS